MLRFLLLVLLLPLLGAADPVLPDDDLPAVVQVGAGSYASRPPRDQNRRPWLPGKAGWGDESQVYSRMRLYVAPDHRGPVPSTDWWTSLVSRRWSGDLWAYPAVVRAVPAGIEVGCPRAWTIGDNGKRAGMHPAVRLLVGGEGFVPQHAEATSWGDWHVRFRLPDGAGRALDATIAHGMPFTWIACEQVEPWIELGDATLSGPGAQAVADRIGINVAGEAWACYAPPGTRFVRSGTRLALRFAGRARWLALAPLTAPADLDKLAPYAAIVPRATRVAWTYEPAEGAVRTTWTVEAEDLDGKGRSDVLQGWIPHHWLPPSRLGFAADGPRYATPRGELRLAAGRSFAITLPFAGLLPEYPAPAEGAPYRPELMRQLVTDHLARPGYGSETYWGGKKVLLLARYMELARQLGMRDEMRTLRDRAAEAVRDWLTFEPGEGEHFLAWYPNWGSLVGCRSRDNANPGVDVLQDHHMCYGYHVYAAALLMLQDPAFAKDYGPMARLMAKDYAEWEADSRLFCRFRNLDPWSGHSWSGGMGSDDGNGQESSSEAMQGYGAMFLLGEALGDQAMRDAAAFCWASEARGIAAYYFDRAKTTFPAGWPHTMATNLHTEGIGFWTWFSGNPFWMHAIQWMPMSPLLSHLAEDPAYAKADFARMWATHEGGKGWDGYLGTDTGVSNIAMNYLANSDVEQAAQVFQRLSERGLGGAKGAEPGPTYWRIHALRRLGPHRFDAWTDVATSQAFGAAGQPPSWVVFNATDAPRTVRCFVEGRQVASFSAPPRRLSVMREGVVTSDPGSMEPVPSLPKPGGLVVEPAVAIVGELGTARFSAVRVDAAGKRTPVQATWRVDGRGRIAADGTFTPDGFGTFDRPRVAVIATVGGESATGWAAVEEARRIGRIELTPSAKSGPIALGVGARLAVSATALDQFGAWIATPPQLEVAGPLRLEQGAVVTTGLGTGTVRAVLAGQRAELAIEVVSADRVDIAAGCPASASSAIGGNTAAAAVDRDGRTRWESARSDPQWLAVDLGALRPVARVALAWEAAHAKAWRLEASDDGVAWRTVHEQPACRGGREEIVLPSSVRCRHLRLFGTARAGGYGYSLFSFEAYPPR